MKVHIDGAIYDSEKTPITIIMEDDKERKEMVKNISNMGEADGPRFYAVYNEELIKPPEMERQFNVLTDYVIEKGYKNI